MELRYVLDLSRYKLNSCIEDRILTCAQCVLRKEMNDKPEIYKFLESSHLEFRRGLLEDNRADSWYKQPMRIITDQGNDLSTAKGFQDLCVFMKSIGILCKRINFLSVDRICRMFYDGWWIIVIIDQFRFPNSEKYRKTKEAYHALLINGIDEDKEMFYYARPQGQQDGVCSFGELRRAMRGGGVVLRKTRVEDKRKLTDKNWVSEGKRSVTSRQAFLSVLRDEAMEKTMREGCIYAIEYKIRPYLQACSLFSGNEGLASAMTDLEQKWHLLTLQLIKMNTENDGYIMERIKETIDKLCLIEKQMSELFDNGLEVL